MVTRYFDLFINSGGASPLTIHANQNDSGENWVFTLYDSNGAKVIPTSGQIIGMKTDKHAIINAGTVNNSGQIVITETAQMTAAAGMNIFELKFDSVHGTANFIVDVERSPVDEGSDLSDSDISAINQAIQMGIDAQTVNILISRVENIIAGTPGDQELVDIRVGADGTTYQSAGTAVRTQVSNLENDISILKTATEYINCANRFKTNTTKQITMTANSDDTFTFNGTSTSAVTYDAITILPGTYKYERSVISGTSTATFQIRYTNTNNSNTTWPVNSELTFDEETSIVVRLGIGSCTDYVVKLLIYETSKPITAIDHTARASMCATPELFGAYGDGVHDDSEAINKAIAASNDICMDKTYLVGSTIEITSNKKITLNGSIHYTGETYAVRLTGSDIILQGAGSIVSEGQAAIFSTDLRYADISLRGGLTCAVEGSYVIYISAHDGVYRNYFHDMHIIGGTSNDNKLATGIYIRPNSDGYINENTFERLTLVRCTDAVYINNINGVSRVDGDSFIKIDASTSDIQLRTRGGDYGINGNSFEYRSDEYSDKTGIFVLDDFTLNKLSFNMRIKPCIFTKTKSTSPSLYTNNTPAPNKIIAPITPNGSNGFVTYDATLMMNGTTAVLNYCCGRTMSDDIAGDENNLFQLSWDNSVNLVPGLEVYVITAAALTFDLNYVSDWYNCPLHYLEIRNESGCNIEIINNTDSAKKVTLFESSHLSSGLYKVIYSTKRTIKLFKVS